MKEEAEEAREEEEEINDEGEEVEEDKMKSGTSAIHYCCFGYPKTTFGV